MSSISLRSLLLCATAAAVLPPSATLRAQQNTTPNVWFVACNLLKPGTSAEMRENESAWARAYEKAGVIGSIGMTSITGPAQVCWITNTSNYDGADKMFNKAGKTDAQFERATRNYASDARTYLAETIPTLLTPTDGNALKYQGITWQTWTIRPGTDALFRRAVSAYDAARKRAGVSVGDAVVVQPTQGAAQGVYWIMIGYRSMADMDRGMGEEAKVTAAFTADDQKVFQEFFEKAVVSSRSDNFRFSSQLSALSAEQRKAGGDFWKLPAPAAAKKP